MKTTGIPINMYPRHAPFAERVKPMNGTWRKMM